MKGQHGHRSRWSRAGVLGAGVLGGLGMLATAMAPGIGSGGPDAPELEYSLTLSTAVARPEPTPAFTLLTPTSETNEAGFGEAVPAAATPSAAPSDRVPTPRPVRFAVPTLMAAPPKSPGP